MSLHLNLEDFHCTDCDFLYFPYKENYPCPKCGFVPNSFPNDYIDLVDGIVRSLKINKMRGDSFIPMGWSIISFCDQVQLIVANIFEILETEEYTDEESRIDRFILERLNNFNDNLKKHIKEIIVDVRSHYKLDPYVDEEENSLLSRLWQRILSLFRA